VEERRPSKPLVGGSTPSRRTWPSAFAESLAIFGDEWSSEGDGEDTLLLVEVESEAAIRSRLADDPWGNEMLTIMSVEPWSVWLRATS
jgi:hypothetical protein